MKRNKTLFRMVINMYLNFAKQVSNNPHIEFSCTDNEGVMIDNFIREMNEEVGNEKILGNNHLINYFEFQFNYWLSKKVERKSSKMIDSINTHPYISWIVGKKAILRWKSRDKKKSKYAIKLGLKKEVKLKSNQFRSEWKKIIIEINKIEEEVKNKFYNTKKGFLYCYINTTLYNHKSPFCSLCNKKEECKETLKKEHFNVYKVRGYVEEVPN